jgi:hypothetical protein
MSLYKKAQKLLHSEYKRNFEIVKGSLYHKSYANEKIRHSLQVAGAGNGILRNEAYFQNKSAEFMEIAKTAILLHDVFRFNEIRIHHQENRKIDHGVEGAKLLSEISDFNNPLIVLPVKHHGHMIEEFYADKEYNDINDEELKDQIRHIIFAVRDADKIANWQILTKEYENMRLVWLPYPNDTSLKQGIISDKIWEAFINGKITPRNHIKTNADTILSVIAWCFDLNYKYSVEYCMRLKHLEGFEKIMTDLQVEPEKIDIIINTVKNYLKERFQL